MKKIPTKFIFLDIDGVIATNLEYDRNRVKYWDKYDDAKQLRIPYPYNPDCVRILNEIQEVTGAETILTSDWRTMWTNEEMFMIFSYNGIKKMPYGFTEILFDSHKKPDKIKAEYRSVEINAYIETNDIKKYIVLDDLDMSPYFDKTKFVKTRDADGLKQTSAKKKIIDILNNEG